MHSNIDEPLKVIIVGVDFYRDNNFEYYMKELNNLAHACGFNVVGELTQKLDKVNSRHYVGTGKIKELQDLVEDLEPDLIITNNELTGSTNRNLEKLIEKPIMDRTQLILEIFSIRA